jgi:hypothetical protein
MAAYENEIAVMTRTTISDPLTIHTSVFISVARGGVPARIDLRVSRFVPIDPSRTSAAARSLKWNAVALGSAP